MNTLSSATPKDYAPFVAQISKMWEIEWNWTDAHLARLEIPPRMDSRLANAT